METPSLVIVGAPHFLSRTTLRPLGPSVTRTASASWFIPLSRARRALSSNAIIFGIRVLPPLRPGHRAVSTLYCRVLTSKPRVGRMCNRGVSRRRYLRSPSGDGRDDADGLAGRHHGLEAVGEADVLVGHEHVDE